MPLDQARQSRMVVGVRCGWAVMEFDRAGPIDPYRVRDHHEHDSPASHPRPCQRFVKQTQRCAFGGRELK